jgi:hypothetical protein
MSNPAIYNYSTRNIFVWNNRFNSISATYTNSTGSEVTLEAGMLIGRIAATGLVVQSVSTATDGSQVPIGILTQDYTVANGDSVNVSFCIQGDVDYGMLVFGGSPVDTLSTVISLTDSGSATVKIGTIGEILNGKGILPINTSEMTYRDNQ